MKALLALLLVVALLAGAAAAWVYFGVGQPFRGYSTSEQFVEIPSGARHARDRRSAGAAPASFAITMTFRAALWKAGPRDEAEGRRVSLHGSDDAARR